MTFFSSFEYRPRVGWLAALLPALLRVMLMMLVLPPAQAATLFAVVTDRAAPDAMEAARLHLRQHPRDQVRLRTPAQLMAASDKQLAQWLNADAVLAVSVFGDPARRLLEALPASRAVRILALNGEQRLTLQSRSALGRLAGTEPELLRQLAGEAPPPEALARARQSPATAEWLAARQHWQAGGPDNLARVFSHVLDGHPLPAPRPEPTLRLRAGDAERLDDAAWGAALLPSGPALVVLDLSNTESGTAAALCAESRRQGLACAQVLTRWGSASRTAIERLPELLAPARPVGLVVVQDFVVGAAENREAVTEALQRLDLPVFKAIRLTERTATQWRLSPEGLPVDSVQYRVALPELQGIGQPIVVAAAGPTRADPLTGIETRQSQPIPEEMSRLIARARRWQQLQHLPNQDKRIALIYYNHPPGRQNIGADNLDVPASLFAILQRLKAEGYTVGDLPPSPEALLEQIMARGVNLPEDRAALAELAQHSQTLEGAAYGDWFARLPERVRLEMVSGPLGRLHAERLEAEARGERSLGRKRLEAVMKELHHLAEGADHPRRQDAIAGLHHLEQGYLDCLGEHPRQPCSRLTRQVARLVDYRIEGLRGWGPAPGRVMVHGGRQIIPGLRFGNIFVGPQPPRGWEVDEELLHANTSVPPPHQFLGFYHWLRDEFRADAVVHLGRHSTYEFLPGKAVGLTADDYPSLVASDLPGIYPYIVDGVGEGIQAKRRGLAVIVDHLTPPLAATPLYDQLLSLRQVVESFEAASSESLKAQAARRMREQVIALNLRTELEASMADVLEVRGIGFEEADDDLLAHEVGHYLTKLQEKFMPHGLHVFGQDWTPESLQLMADSMGQMAGGYTPEIARRLADSPRLEMAGLLAGLAGRYLPPGKGNDPLRSPEALPTGRNFHAVDGDILPTRLGYELGRTLATQARPRQTQDASDAVILWASDAVRDEGAMLGFCLALMGAEPVWNARGIVTDVRLLDAPRRDVLITTSGLFRDLYPNLLNQVDRAGRLALAASAQPLLAQAPELAPALDAALAPIPGAPRGDQPLADNLLARMWLMRTRQLLSRGLPLQEAGPAASLRVFGDAPGAYSAGVNRLAERSGAWQTRDELGRVYLRRMGHAYGLDASGEAAHLAFETALAGVARSYHGRASNLYGLLDNNDAFDYLGGLSLGVETLTGQRPEGLILQHADPAHPAVEALPVALLGELRGRYLNPEWIKPLMKHGYAGARTMGQEFLENLWGWQVTRPELIQPWAWDEVKATYFDDKQKLGLPKFLEQGPNAHVKAQMLAIFMVAAHKGFWQTDPATLRRMGGELARLVGRNGLPGSGHTAPNHPMWAWLAPQLDAADAQALNTRLERARGEDASPQASSASQPRPQPLNQARTRTTPTHTPQAAPANAPPPPPRYSTLTRRPPATQPAALPSAPPETLTSLALLCLLLGLGWSRRPLPSTSPRKFTDE
ncbi:MAG: cobaltochelatase subunit CobN [Zoogloea sp.]|uniref:cobaltochelatase subunit CobN n=1 Tax=Zoogloea sp. TaxID=49181 RepID=UPI003F412839